TGPTREPAPEAVRVLVLAPVPARGPKRRVAIGVASTREARAFPPLEGERLHELDAVGAAGAEGAAHLRRVQGIAPEQQALGPGAEGGQASVAAGLPQHVAA